MSGAGFPRPVSGHASSPDTPARSLNQAIEETQRELSLRRSAYPRFVNSGKLRKGEADEHLARMEAALHYLLWLRENRERIEAGFDLLKALKKGSEA